jgi:type IV secretion system protein VirB10
MTWQDRSRRRFQANRPEDHDTPDIDPDTGEVLSGQGAADAGNERSRTAAEHTTIRGERAIPSVNRERSIQSRISGGLALATIILLGAGFLFWYYNTQYAKTRQAEEAARKAAVARAGGEMKVPPLGRIQPPRAPSETAPASDQ